MTSVLTPLVPQWTARMYPGKQGRDPLGVGSVSSDQILPLLSPAINVLTFHPRYHSFYIFLLDEFWSYNEAEEITQDSWRAFFRPREFFFSLAAHLPSHAAACPAHGEMGNIVGAIKTKGAANEAEETVRFNPDYIKSSLGGYGLYYRSVMAELGLIYPAFRGSGLPVDKPRQPGKALAAAYRSSVADSVFYKTYFHRQDLADIAVPTVDLEAFINQGCLCQLQRQSAPDRLMVRQLFLPAKLKTEEPTSEAQDDPAAVRLATFRLLLDIIDQTDGDPLTQPDFRHLLYFQVTSSGQRYLPDPAVQGAYRRWRLYQTREYYAAALNGMLETVSAWGRTHGADLRPQPFERFLDFLKPALDFGPLATHLGVADPRLTADSPVADLLDWLNGQIGRPTPSLDEPFGADDALTEQKLFETITDQRNETWALATGTLALLGLLAVRFSDPALHQAAEWDVAKHGADGRLPFERFVQSMTRKTEHNASIYDVAAWLYREYVVNQHLNVAGRKLPENTFRFQRDGAGLRFFHIWNSINMMNSRFDSLTTTLHELGLCGDVGLASHPLTADGRWLLEHGELLE